jgi:hypothetical protein
VNTTELLSLFRVEMDDRDSPPLWEDEAIYRYIDDAQKMFCRKTYGIPDGRSFAIAVTPGEEWYSIDKRILSIRKAYDKRTGREIDVVAREHAEGANIRFEGLGGPTRAIVTGLESNTVRLWQLPTTANEIGLEVYRLPTPLGVEGDEELEVDEQHHMHLLLWVKHLALRNHDSETFNRAKAADFEAEFYRYCDAAKTEQSRRETVNRTVRYGGL